MPPINDTTQLEQLKASKILLITGISLLLLLAAYAILNTTAKSEPAGQGAAATTAANPFANIEILAKGAIVVDLQTGETLYEKNASAQLPLASLTKAALAIVVSDALPQDTVITIPHYVESSTSPENLTTGERWRIQDVINFTLVTSSNGGAEVLAAAANDAIREKYAGAPEEDAALWRMNQFVQELGLSETFFLNVSGLDESETLSGAYGSARDTAKLFSIASQNYSGVFARTAQDGIRLTSPSGEQRTIAYNTNDVLGDVPGLILGKTGLTDLAGGNLAVVFDVGIAHPVVAVVLGSTKDGRFSDMKLLVEKTRERLGSASQ